MALVVERPMSVPLSARMSEASPTKFSTSERQKLAGTWICTEVTGNPDGFLEDMELSLPLRLLAHKLGYLANRSRQEISFPSPDTVKVVIQVGPRGRQATSHLVIGGGLQDYPNFFHWGGIKQVDPKWDGDAFQVNSPAAGLKTWRFMEGDRMVTVLESAEGRVMRRVHEREKSVQSSGFFRSILGRRRRSSEGEVEECGSSRRAKLLHNPSKQL